MSRVRRRFLALLVALPLVALSACSPAPQTGKSTTTASPGTGGSLTFLFPTAPVDLDPSTSQDNNVAMPMWNAWFQYLIQPKSAGAGYDPMLAKTWTTSSDLRTYTFTLDERAVFSNGDALTAADVVSSLKRDMAPSVSLLNGLGTKISSITATDARTVTIALKEPWPHLLADLASPTAAIYSTSSLAAAKDPKTFFNTAPVGTGPFTLGSVVANTSYTAQKNAKYWDTSTAAHLSTIVFKVVTDDSARVNAVSGGSAQIAQSPPANQMKALGARSDVKALAFTAARVELIALNTTKAPFDNKAVRQAFSLAIDRAAIVQTGLFGNATVASSFLVPPGSVTFQNPSLALYKTDVAKAKALIASAGVPTPIPVTLEVSTGTDQDAILTIAQAGLQQAGFAVTASKKDAASVDNDIIGMKYMANTTFWGDVSANPSTQPLFTIDPDYCCKAYFTGYDDPALVAKTKQAVATSDRAAAQTLWDAVQTSVADAAFVVPLYYPKLTYVAQATVAGFAADPYGFYDWASVGYAK